MRSECVNRPIRNTLHRAIFGAVAGIYILLSSVVLVRAQNVVLTGSLSGRVSDPSGAVVPGVSVMVQNLATGVQQSAITNRAGIYGFPAVMPGRYSIAASFKGFRDVEVLARVLVGNTTVQDIKLQVGTGAEIVRVSATPPLLRTAETSASTVMERSFIGELPTQRTPLHRLYHAFPEHELRWRYRLGKYCRAIGRRRFGIRQWQWFQCLHCGREQRHQQLFR